MSGRRLHFVPETKGWCALYLVVGLLLTVSPIWQMVHAGEVAVFPAIAVVAGLALAVTAVIGLAAPRLRGR
ncbi:hypothetical protein ACGFMK_47825 [Amycolatopsis sp. NPDC049252]|uniref:hypothetical protein n=1 Tax=unclassified Amycolatopsis TaxID=2618356 RepID=UPI003720790E